MGSYAAGHPARGVIEKRPLFIVIYNLFVKTSNCDFELFNILVGFLPPIRNSSLILGILRLLIQVDLLGALEIKMVIDSFLETRNIRSEFYLRFGIDHVWDVKTIGK